MKNRLLLFLGIAIVAASTVHYIRKEPAGAPYSAPIAGPGEKLTVTTAPAEIFRRAFWRHPVPEDVILHAERREWTQAETNSVVRWQWYLSLHPSPGLLQSLRDPETFGLQTAAAGSVADYSGAPPWFPASGKGFEILQSPAATLRVLYRKADNALFATDAGHGFTPPQNQSVTSAAAR